MTLRGASVAASLPDPLAFASEDGALAFAGALGAASGCALGGQACC